MTTISNYYISKYGNPEREAEFVSPEGKKILIYKWNEDQTGEGVAMYATIGASHSLGCEQHTCEFFIGMTPSADNVVQALAEVALHGNGSDKIPDSGDTLTLVYDLWEGTKAKSFMFTDGEEILPPLSENGKHVEFIQLIPLFDSELQYKKEHGEEFLWDRFEEKEVPYWDSSRESAF